MWKLSAVQNKKEKARFGPSADTGTKNTCLPGVMQTVEVRKYLLLMNKWLEVNNREKNSKWKHKRNGYILC